MRHSLKGHPLSGVAQNPQHNQNLLQMALGVARAAMLLLAGVGLAGGVTLFAQDSSFTLDRDGRSIVIEPYAPNIVRVTLSKTRNAAGAAPGYGFVATPTMAGWTRAQDDDGNDVFRSARLVVRISPDQLPPSRLQHRMQLDELNQSLRDHYFGTGNGRGPNSDTVSVTTASGETLLNMRNWSMFPNRPETAAAHAASSQQNDPGYRVSATFDSPADEHYYGLGQQQEGALDLRDHRIRCWHDYGAVGGESVCVPFMISTRGYGLIWDNPSKTTIDLGFNQQNVWSSEVGDRVSFFLIAGENSD